MRILDVPYDNLRFDDAVDRLSALYGTGRPAFVTYLNIDCLRLTAEEPDYKQILQNADMVLPDGTALRIATRLAGQRKADHYIITDVFVATIERLAGQGAKFYFLGGPPGVAEAAAEVMRQRLPKIAVVGTHDGFFKDDEAMIAAINQSGADVLIVGTGAPRQERWLHKHRDRLQPQCRWAVGALFTWISGHQARAPMLFQKLYLEWFWRLLHEPQRLFVRYFVHDLPFLLSLPLKGVKAEPGTAERP